MRTQCPLCCTKVVQPRNDDGPNFCPACCKPFYPVDEVSKVPPWILGVVVILMGNFQILTFSR